MTGSRPQVTNRAFLFRQHTFAPHPLARNQRSKVVWRVPTTWLDLHPNCQCSKSTLSTTNPSWITMLVRTVGDQQAIQWLYTSRGPQNPPMHPTRRHRCVRLKLECSRSPIVKTVGTNQRASARRRSHAALANELVIRRFPGSSGSRSGPSTSKY